MSYNGKPGYTGSLPVTDAAEVDVIAHTYCNAIYVQEQSTASGWPRTFLMRGSGPGSVQNPQTPNTQICFPGQFAPGDLVGKVELASNGGDSSTFNVVELNQ